ncbi:lysM domain protein [Nonlabens ulvanivorans]|uniref:LysM domain protein n=1 Tax=Nonlabens ulvanivorans TaxID=906888 RepID=A0A081DBA7_NONUL|nr:lysM domain protein [Nonlabens ulvanivorans]GAK94961.1 lysM domain protein [Nonlabens ulvanivorans]
MKLDSGVFKTSVNNINEEFYDADAFIGPVTSSNLFDVRYYSLAITPPDSFLTFREALAFKESQGKFWKVNSLGYMGEISIWYDHIRNFRC